MTYTANLELENIENNDFNRKPMKRALTKAGPRGFMYIDETINNLPNNYWQKPVCLKCKNEFLPNPLDSIYCKFCEKDYT